MRSEEEIHARLEQIRNREDTYVRSDERDFFEMTGEIETLLWVLGEDEPDYYPLYVRWHIETGRKMWPNMVKWAIENGVDVPERQRHEFMANQPKMETGPCPVTILNEDDEPITVKSWHTTNGYVYAEVDIQFAEMLHVAYNEAKQVFPGDTVIVDYEPITEDADEQQ